MRSTGQKLLHLIQANALHQTFVGVFVRQVYPQAAMATKAIRDLIRSGLAFLVHIGRDVDFLEAVHPLKFTFNPSLLCAPAPAVRHGQRRHPVSCPR